MTYVHTHVIYAWLTDTKNSVAEGDAPGGGADSTEVVLPDTTNHILSFQVWRPWAD